MPASPVMIGGFPKNKTSTGAVYSGPCYVSGFFVNSTSSGTIAFDDNGTSLGAAFTALPGWNAFPFIFSTNCNVTIGGTMDVTISYVPLASVNQNYVGQLA